MARVSYKSFCFVVIIITINLLSIISDILPLLSNDANGLFSPIVKNSLKTTARIVVVNVSNIRQHNRKIHEKAKSKLTKNEFILLLQLKRHLKTVR